METAADPLAVVQGYHRAWTSRDFASARGYLSPTLETDVPINTYSGPGDWIEAVERTRNMADGVELLAELSNEGEALLLYDMLFPLPLGKLRVAEHFAVSGDRITRIRHVHDTYALRSLIAGGQPTAHTDA